ncbi:hypothetical protein ACJMK2_020835 [Sinanodonta woodiana]|uniref:Uncharacterized protein n=1 Tax=Sinanodonta woodiana TaxID=1069815 RepID=A0ABD3U0C7_SINWO
MDIRQRATILVVIGEGSNADLKGRRHRQPTSKGSQQCQLLQKQRQLQSWRSELLISSKDNSSHSGPTARSGQHHGCHDDQILSRLDSARQV